MKHSAQDRKEGEYKWSSSSCGGGIPLWSVWRARLFVRRHISLALYARSGALRLIFLDRTCFPQARWVFRNKGADRVQTRCFFIVCSSSLAPPARRRSCHPRRHGLLQRPDRQRPTRGPGGPRWRGLSLPFLAGLRSFTPLHSARCACSALTNGAPSIAGAAVCVKRGEPAGGGSRGRPSAACA